YIHIARHLAAADETVYFISQHDFEHPGMRKLVYRPLRPQSQAHPFAREFEAAIENGLAVAQICEHLKREGFHPDLVIGHNGWGETLYVKDVWPAAPLLGYCEFFYRSCGSDVDFDPEFPPEPDQAKRLRTRNSINLLALDAIDW